MASPRVCVIGLDGTPASYLRRRIADGFLPHLAELSRQGTLMSARAPLPPISSVSWASASTGVNPGRHGVFGFVERKPGSWDLTFTNVFTIAEPQVWARAARGRDALGRRQHPRHLPGPAERDGVLVSGFVSPTLERSVQPPSLIPFLQERDYLIDVDLGLGHKDLDAFCEQLFAHHAARTRVLVDLLERRARATSSTSRSPAPTGCTTSCGSRWSGARSRGPRGSTTTTRPSTRRWASSSRACRTTAA